MNFTFYIDELFDAIGYGKGFSCGAEVVGLAARTATITTAWHCLYNMV
jgi:hypothetical protein